jgi:hypothetical protein
VSDVLDKGLLYSFCKKLKKAIQDEETLWKNQHQVPDPYSTWYGIIQSFYNLQCDDRIEYIRKKLEIYFSKDRVDEIISTSTRVRDLWNK